MRGTPRVTPTGPRHKRVAPGALVRRLVEEACNDGNLAVLDEVLALPVAVGDGSAPDDPDGQNARDAPGDTVGQRLRPLLAAFRAAVPDAHWTITEQITAGDTVVTRLAVRGAFSGPLLGLAPPGRPATLTGVAICRFAGGGLVDVWLQADLLGLLQQLVGHIANRAGK